MPPVVQHESKPLIRICSLKSFPPDFFNLQEPAFKSPRPKCSFLSRERVTAPNSKPLRLRK
jgi:hypothetical protein